VHTLSPIDDDDSEVEIEASANETVVPKKTNGEILFDAFHKLDSERKLVEFVSLGSVYMQSDCLDFAQKISNHGMTIESGGKTEFTKDMLVSANTLLKLKRQLDAGEQKRIKKEEAAKEQKIIEQEKSSMEDGEWEFNEFLTQFKEYRNEKKKFVLHDGGKYRTNPVLVKYAEKIIGDENSNKITKEAATYLIRWNERPDDAKKEANKADAFFSLPPPPPAPRLQSVAALPEVKPVPMPPEQSAIIKLVSADDRHKEGLRVLISFSSPQMRSGLAALSRIWQSEPSSSSADKNLARVQLKNPSTEYESYTDLEEIDNAIKLITALADMKTGHNFELSAEVGKIKEHRDPIIQNLRLQRSQIIKGRSIVDVTKLTEDQLGRGANIFEQFLDSYRPAQQRGELDKLRMTDIYFSDECMSFAGSTHEFLLRLPERTEADADRLEAVGYLLNKYNQFKALANDEGIASA
jgi:hypothetical protein